MVSRPAFQLKFATLGLSLLFIAALGCSDSAGGNSPTAQEVVNGYTQAWVKRDYKKMYKLMSSNAQKTMGLEQVRSEVTEWESAMGHPSRVMDVQEPISGLSYVLVVAPGVEVMSVCGTAKEDECVFSGQCSFLLEGDKYFIAQGIGLSWLDHPPSEEQLKGYFSTTSPYLHQSIPCLPPQTMWKSLKGFNMEKMVVSYFTAWVQHDWKAMLEMLSPAFRTRLTQDSFRRSVTTVEEKYFRPIRVAEVDATTTYSAVKLQLDGTGRRWRQRRQTKQTSTSTYPMIWRSIPLTREKGMWRINATETFLSQASAKQYAPIPVEPTPSPNAPNGPPGAAPYDKEIKSSAN